jgi:hypothetical protein
MCERQESSVRISTVKLKLAVAVAAPKQTRYIGP